MLARPLGACGRHPRHSSVFAAMGTLTGNPHCRGSWAMGMWERGRAAWEGLLCSPQGQANPPQQKVRIPGQGQAPRTHFPEGHWRCQEIPKGLLGGPGQSILSVAWSILCNQIHTGGESQPPSSRVTLDKSFLLLEP